MRVVRWRSRTPASTAWLLSGSVAVMLACVALAARALPDEKFPQGMAGQITPTFLVAAAAILAIGGTRPAPIVLVSAVSVLLAVTWFWLFVVFLAFGGVPTTLDESGFEDG